jgi:hypothetical protein
MKTETEIYKAKLLSKDSNIQTEAINQLVNSGDIPGMIKASNSFVDRVAK